MTKSYHVIFVPMFDWRLYIPENPQQLIFIMHSAANSFRFTLKREINWKERSMTTEKYEKLDIHSPILFSGLPLLKHEVPHVWEITDLLGKYCKEEVEALKIEKAYISYFAIEIVSANSDILDTRTNYFYQNIARKISHILFDGLKFDEIQQRKFGVITCAMILNVIICESSKEVEETVPKDDFTPDKNDFCIFGPKNAFDFIKYPWSTVNLRNFIVTLHPKQLLDNYLSAEKVGSYISFAIAMGTLYNISETISSICANLEYESWYLDEFFFIFEKSFKIFKRNFFNLESRLFDILRNVKELAQPLTLLYTSPKSIKFLEREYGGSFFPHVARSYNTISHSFCSDYLGRNKVEDFRSDIYKDLKIFSECIEKFIEKFQKAADSWRNLHQGKLNHNILIVTILALLATILSSLITLFFR